MSSAFGRQPFGHSTIMELSSSRVGLSKLPNTTIRHNFLSFLATAQALKIEFLPITWQSAQRQIGQGGTSKINQALANIQTSLAFKRIDDDTKLKTCEAEIFHMLSNELIVLGHPSIQEHPHIARLQGICWDVSSDGKVWPVLVFEKSHFEDMYRFATRPIGKELDIHQRFKLCLDIGEAIIYMHSHNIVHGDVKPENILIFKDHDGTYTARVTDFGYSTRYASDTNLIMMAISSPWNAPEHDRNHKMWTPSEAKKIDFFSVGMSCLWILFEEKLSAPTPSFHWEAYQGGHEIPCSLMEQSREILRKYKIDRNLPLLAHLLVEAETNLIDDEKRALKEFFASVLDKDQNRRDMKAGNLFKRTGHFIASSRLEGAELVVSDLDFKMQKSIMELYKSDYRVRLFIARCLEETLSYASAPPITNSINDIASQVAFCYELGFGLRRDKDKSARVLQEYKCDEINGEKIVSNWKRLKRNKDLVERAYLRSTSEFLYYSENKVLEQAEKQLFQEVEDTKQSLGAENDVVLLLEVTISSFLSGKGQWKKAEELQQQVLEISNRVFGPEHLDTLTSMANLASTYSDQGEWEKAEESLQQVLEISNRVLGPEHPHTLSRMADLASIYSDQGQQKKAEESLQQVLEISNRVLGPEHPDTLNRMANLASTYNRQAQWKKAEQSLQRVLELSNRVLGPEHPDSLTIISNLASTYSYQGQWKKVEELKQQVLEISNRVLGPEHPDTLTTMADLISIYSHQGQWKKVEDLQQQEQEISSIISDQGRWKKVEEFLQQVLETSNRVLGLEHPSTLISMANLTRIYSYQGEWKKAEELKQQVLEISNRVLGPEHPDTLIGMANLAVTFKFQTRDKEASSLMRRCFELQKKVLGPGHPNTEASLKALQRWGDEKRD